VKNRSANALNKVFLFFVFLFLYAPIIVMIIFSFNDSTSRTVWSGFTMKWYSQLFSDELIMSSLYVTLAVALLASIIATFIGTIAALGIDAMRPGPKAVMLNVNNIPVMNPDIITGVSLLLLFTFMRMEGSFWTLLLAHVTFNIPYVILSVLPKLGQLDKFEYEAALDLGATPREAFFKVILPEISPGIMTGMMMAFTLSIDDFLVSYFTSGSKAQTLAMTIFSMTKKRVSPKINAVSTIMFVTVLALLIIINIRQSRERRREEKKLRHRDG